MERVDFMLQSDLKKALERLARKNHVSLTKMLQLSAERTVREQSKLTLL